MVAKLKFWLYDLTIRAADWSCNFIDNHPLVFVGFMATVAFLLLLVN